MTEDISVYIIMMLNSQKEKIIIIITRIIIINPLSKLYQSWQKITLNFEKYLIAL